MIIERPLLQQLEKRIYPKRDTIENSELPKISLSRFGISERQSMLHLANMAWENAFHKEKFLHTLQETPSDEQRKYLKRVRKYGSIAKNALFLATCENTAPESHREFLRRLGHLNDHYADPQRVMYVEAVSQAADILQPLSSQDVAVASDEKFQQTIHTMKDTVAQTIALETIPIAAFHKMRKQLRVFVNGILLLSFVTPEDTNLLKTYTDAFHTVQDLGQMHDEIIQTDRRSRESSKSVTLDEATQRRIIRFLDSLVD